MAGWLLTGPSWAVLTVHTLWFAVKGYEMWRFWGMRNKMKIHARSPTLALVSGIGGGYMQFIIMLFEIGAQEGNDIPCVVMLYSNAVVMAFYPGPYLLRGLRVVIVSDKAWRAKYSTLLSLRNVKIMIISTFVTMALASVMLQFVSQQTYGPNATEVCFALDDWWFYGPVCGLCAAMSSKLFIELSRVQDRIHMSKEISMAAVAWLATAVPFYSCFILNDFGFMVAPRQLNFLLSVCIALTDLSTFFIEPRRHKGEIQICNFKKKKVAVVIDEPQIARWKEQWYNSRVIMNEPQMDMAFEKHVQDYLCSESYDFLKAHDVYVEEAATVELHPQFMKFRQIVDMYILAGSELEVNIETAMRNKVLKIGDQSDFMTAEGEKRRDIFNASGTEIRKMLDENLLKTFLASTAFFNTCKLLEEQHEQSASMSTMVEPQQTQTTMLLVPFDGVVPKNEHES